MTLSRAVLAALVVLALAVAPAGASVQGDTGQAPTNAAQCKAFLKSVDADLQWENNRHAKARDKKLDRRAALGKKVKALEAEQGEIKAKEKEIIASLEVEPPPANEVIWAGTEELDELRAQLQENRVKIKDLRSRIEGLNWELGELKKLHRSNVRNTIKYRKQIAAYCRRF